MHQSMLNDWSLSESEESLWCSSDCYFYILTVVCLQCSHGRAAKRALCLFNSAYFLRPEHSPCRSKAAYRGMATH